MAMQNFGVSNASLSKDGADTLVIDLSKIMLWYREDFYLSKNDIPAMLYFLVLPSDSEHRQTLLEFFEVKRDLSKEFKTDAQGLLCWDKKMLSSALSLKKGKKFKITWKEYDWGTNSK